MHRLHSGRGTWGQSILSGVDYFAFGDNNDGVEFLAWSEKGRDVLVRMARAEVLDSADIAVARVYNRTVRRCFLICPIKCAEIRQRLSSIS